MQELPFASLMHVLLFTDSLEFSGRCLIGRDDGSNYREFSTELSGLDRWDADAQDATR